MSRSRGFHYFIYSAGVAKTRRSDLATSFRDNVSRIFPALQQKRCPLLAACCHTQPTMCNPNAKGRALVSGMQPGGGASHTHMQPEMPWPATPRVRASSFRWGELALKQEAGLRLQSGVDRGAAVGPSKSQGQQLGLTQTHTAAIRPQHTDAMHTSRLNS